MGLQGKTALVTGGSRGIGRACVAALAGAGARAALVYQQSREPAEQLAAELNSAGQNVRCWQADVAQAADADRVVEEVLGAWEQIDILVNSAGIIRDGLFATMNPAQWHDVINTNLNGTYNFCRAVAQPMLCAAREASST